jgi:two-component system CheB/CheR fusion protein
MGQDEDSRGSADPDPATAEARPAALRAPDLALPDAAPTASPPVVGIGASAGGLAAVEALFSGMPADTDTGMAFVLVQHLAPDHKSILSELIRRYTRMQVYEVEDGMAVAPDCAYIIPPGRDMALLNGALQLLDPVAPRGQRMPIDFFFRSLAQDQGERAIGIVLSGTGSDGTLGLRAIKGEGGIVLVQTPESAEYDGMPRSALATGLVDFTLAPAEMPTQLIAYAARAFNSPRPVATNSTVAAETALRRICVLVRAKTGHDFSHYKASTLHRRIERRMAVHQIETPEAYTRYLQQTPTEVEALFRDFLIGVTSFFRDHDAFAAIAEQIVPKLFLDRPDGLPVRVWVPGCATGEEAYSLAILLAEHQEALRRSWKVQVFATDIDSQAIATARIGVYPASIAADISPDRLARYFAPEPDGSAYRVNKSIRDLLVFSEQDIISDPPFSRLDLISCRNLLIYLGAGLQRKLIPLFHYALNPDGVLFLGTSESVGEAVDLFTVIDRRLKLYRRQDDVHGAQRAAMARYLPTLAASGEAAPALVGRPATPPRLPLRELTERALLQQVGAVGVLISALGDILYVHGRTGRYLEPAPGEADVSNVIRMAREGLRAELAVALRRAIADHETVRVAGVRVRSNGDFTVANLAVGPVASGSPVPLYLVSLELVATSATVVVAPPAAEVSTDVRIEALRQELRTKEEHLQTANEELETSNEELRSSNEEMQSINEELQSANEELETSKEELQSVNEELATVNVELQTHLADLSRANNDMNNLLAGTGIATVFVDHAQRILRFTPAATRIINLILADVGRPVTHIASNLVDYDRLTVDVQSVLDTLTPLERNVRTIDGACYTMRVLPYRTLDNVIEGVVLTFVDNAAAQQAAAALQETEERVRQALQASSVTVFSQDQDLRYTWIHSPYADLTAGQVLGCVDRQIWVGEEAQELTAIKQGVLTGNAKTRTDVWVTVDGRRCLWDLTVAPLPGPDGKAIGVTGTAVDITDRPERPAGGPGAGEAP